ncbi:twin-arginine translocation signal domain-containing protein [Prosthecobacter fluviatilis]|uniref:Twin-arginine translocation signal domain-containing protein n=1 Tax=Prosthecobacter fluviatilis TaxID=445931 RepID=A0ABW0KZR7_9BACT
MNRRDFLSRSAQAATAGLPGPAFGAISPATSETLVQQLYGSMGETQR